MRRWLLLLCIVAGVGVLGVGCDDDDDPTGPETEPTAPAAPTATPASTPEPTNDGHWVGMISADWQWEWEPFYPWPPEEVMEFEVVGTELRDGRGTFWYHCSRDAVAHSREHDFEGQVILGYIYSEYFQGSYSIWKRLDLRGEIEAPGYAVGTYLAENVSLGEVICVGEGTWAAVKVE